MPYETKTIVKISLGTRDEKEAIRKAAIYNDYIEDYWRNLIKADGSADPDSRYRATVKLAKAHGFAYKSVAEIAKAPLEDVMERVSTAHKSIEKPEIIASVLGGADKPQVLLSQCIEKYWPICADRLANKSDDQIRKWKNPRIAAMNTFTEVVGDRPLHEIARRDILIYRQWWMERVKSGEVVASTVNKNIMYTRDVLQAVGMACEVETDFELLFAKMRLKEVEQSRPPFEASYVQKTFLSSNSLDGLNSEARLLIFAMADTGARESELIGLRGDDIFLGHDIPYIWIRPSKNRALKTPTSERKIPLVSSSLFAFKELPDGFTHYRNADTASTTINKYLRDAQAPEEIIDELMGHKKSGPKYGRGHILERKYEWMKKIEFKI